VLQKFGEPTINFVVSVYLSDRPHKTHQHPIDKFFKKIYISIFFDNLSIKASVIIMGQE